MHNHFIYFIVEIVPLICIKTNIWRVKSISSCAYVVLLFDHLLSQICHSSRPGLSCGKSPPSHWLAVFLSTSSNTWSASFPLQATRNSHPDRNTDYLRLFVILLTTLSFTLNQPVGWGSRNHWNHKRGIDFLFLFKDTWNKWKKKKLHKIKEMNTALVRTETLDLIPLVGIMSKCLSLLWNFFKYQLQVSFYSVQMLKCLHFYIQRFTCYSRYSFLMLSLGLNM